MDLNAIRIFVKVVQAGSFVRAARQLGMPNSTASAKLAALEKRLHVTLLQRTTRKLRLTEAGETYYQHCLRALDEISLAETHINTARQEAQGLLRVTAPVDFGNMCLAGLVATFKQKFPKVALDFVFSNQVLDLVAEGIDVAIRAGRLQDSGLTAKKLGFAHWLPFASPAYLKRAGTPTHPKELGQHDCLQFTRLGDGKWELTRGSTTVRVSVRHYIAANDINLGKTLCVAGYGLALLPTFACHPEIESGALVRVFPEWASRSDPIHIVYPGQKFVDPKVRAFTTVAAEEFKRILQL